MKNITRDELNEILEEHKKWLSGDGGKQADLSNTDLSNTDLNHTDLRHTNLYNANLRYANLRGVDLTDVNLTDVDLKGVDLINANLTGAYLRYCNTEFVTGQNVISVQVNTSRENNKISYWKDLGIWTTGCFQGKLEELKERIEETHKDNRFLDDRYQRAIEYILNESEEEDL